MSEASLPYLGIFVHNQFSPCLFIILDGLQIPDGEFLPLLDAIPSLELRMSER
jgi:hypothetical protein